MTALRPSSTVPGLPPVDGESLTKVLQASLYALTELHLTLKHAHWNVRGPNFITIHEMLDAQVDAVRTMADETAERIAALGGVPTGTPGALVRERVGEDYGIGRADALTHLAALDMVHTQIIGDLRKAARVAGEIDPVTEDLLIGQLRGLEKHHWFIRAQLETTPGNLNER
jgi:starvation-inducible DNA-binding protein